MKQDHWAQQVLRALVGIRVIRVTEEIRVKPLTPDTTRRDRKERRAQTVRRAGRGPWGRRARSAWTDPKEALDLWLV